MFQSLLMKKMENEIDRDLELKIFSTLAKIINEHFFSKSKPYKTIKHSFHNIPAQILLESNLKEVRNNYKNFKIYKYKPEYKGIIVDIKA